MPKKKKIMKKSVSSKPKNLELEIIKPELTLREVIELLADGLKFETCRFGYVSKKKHGGYYDAEEHEILINSKNQKWGKRKDIIHELYHALCDMRGIKGRESKIISITKETYNKLYNQSLK